MSWFANRLRAWNSARLERKYRKQFSPSYWRRKKAGDRLRFRLKNYGFRLHKGVKIVTQGSSIVATLVKSIFWQFFFSSALIGTILLLEWFGRNRDWFLVRFVMDSDAQLTFTSTLLAISATFLGLYFTAVSVVTSTVYARAPGEIRLLVLQEQIGSLYFRILAQFVGISTVALSAGALGAKLGFFSVFLLSAFGLFAAFGFVVLGARTFQYFDPIALAPMVRENISEQINSSTPSGVNWQEQSFQYYFQQEAQEMLSRYADLIALASQKENLNSKGLVQLGCGVVHMLSDYAGTKKRIPPSSYWFQRTNEHKDWLVSSHFEIDVAISTGTTLLPKRVPDYYWFEDAALNSVSEIICQLRSRGDFKGLLSLLLFTNSAMEHVGRSFAIREGLLLLETVSTGIRDLHKVPIPNDRTKGPNVHEMQGILEAYCCSFMNLVIGQLKAVKELNITSFQKIVENSFPKFETIYERGSLPKDVIDECQWVRDCLDFEFRIERQVVTPLWFRLERPARAYVTYLNRSAEELLSHLETVFVRTSGRPIKVEAQLAAAQLAERGIECCAKIKHFLIEVENVVIAFKELDKSKEWQWPEGDWSTLRKRNENVRRELVLDLAEIAPQLSGRSDIEGLPDYFGHAYTVLAEECLASMISGDESTFALVFRSFSICAFQAFDRLRKKFGSNTQTVYETMEPLKDCLALCGYACIYSGLDAKSFWQEAQSFWEKYLKGIGPAQSKTVVQLCYYAMTPHGRIGSRDVQRVQWKMTVKQDFFRRNLIKRDDHSIMGYRARERRIKHESPVVRAFARQLDLFTEPEHVFSAIYLLKRPEASGVDVPIIVRDFGHSLQREETSQDPLEEES